MVIGAVGFVGYKVGTNKQAEPAATVTKNATTQAKAEASKSSTPEGFVEYENKDLGFKFTYPKEWGNVTTDQHARNREDFEPIKTQFISFDQFSKFQTKISPDNWKFTGGASEWDFPLTESQFSKPVKWNPDRALEYLKTSDSYLVAYYAELDDSVNLEGAKKIKLPKIPAGFAEFVWAPVSSSCTVKNATSEDTIPSDKCYDKKYTDQIKKLIESFQAI